MDPGTTSLVAALFSTPVVSRLISLKDRHRQRGQFCRAQLLDPARWLKRLGAVQKPSVMWTTAKTSREDSATTENVLFQGVHPFVTGILISGIAAFVLNLTGALDAVRHFAFPSAPKEIAEVAKFRGVPTVEENVKASLKEIEASVDSIVEAVTPEDSTLTREDVAKQHALIREVWDVISDSYYNERDRTFSKEKWLKLRDEALRHKPKTRNSSYRIIKDMIAKGLDDPYTKLSTAEEFRAMQKYDLTGVGLNVGTTEEFNQKVVNKTVREKKHDGKGIMVMGLLKGSASDRAGIQQGDQILEVNGKSVSESSSYEAAQMIKGDAREGKVLLKMRRNDNASFTVEIVRKGQRTTPSVKTSVERVRLRKVGRVSVTGCTTEVRAAILDGLHDLESKGVREVILDLRGNPGGLVEEAAEIAKLFLSQGDTVYIKRDGSDARETRVTATQLPKTHMRLTVQVDQRTASAAEIIAGALQDNCRGVVVGERTYGKGLIQSVFQLSDGSGLTLTVGKYYTPNMADIDQNGIAPDTTRIPTTSKADEVLNACQLRRSKASK